MASGASVIGLKFNGGVLLASDTLLSYGTLAKLPNVPRTRIIGKNTAICASGDYADFQGVARDLQDAVNSDLIEGDGYEKTPDELFCLLQRTVYGKRCDFVPAICHIVMIGSAGEEAEPFLGAIDDVGTKWSADCVATGFGSHMALPLLRAALDAKGGYANLSADEASAVLQDALRVTFYRDCRTINKFQVAVARKGNVTIQEPFSVDTKWDYEGMSFEKTAIIR